MDADSVHRFAAGHAFHGGNPAESLIFSDQPALRAISFPISVLSGANRERETAGEKETEKAFPWFTWLRICKKTTMHHAGNGCFS
jgi:hypothetical protein